MPDSKDFIKIESLLFIALHSDEKEFSLKQRDKAGKEILVLFKELEKRRNEALQNQIQININPGSRRN